MLEDRLTPSAHATPTIHLSTPEVLAPNDILSTAGAVSDPQGTSWIAHVDYGDGTGAQSLPVQPDHTFILNHTYARDGVFEVSVVVEDDLGATALARVNVQAASSPWLAVPKGNPAVPAVPPNSISSFISNPTAVRSQATDRSPETFPGYLVEAIGDDNLTWLKSDPVEAQVAREFPSAHQADTGSREGNQADTRTEVLLLEKLQKTTAASPKRPAAKKTTDGAPDFSYQPKNHFSQETKPAPNDRQEFKKNVRIMIRLQPLLFREDMALRLLARPKPGNVFLAVVVLGWGIKRPKFRKRNRQESNHPRNRRQWEWRENSMDFKEGSATARAPPQ